MFLPPYKQSFFFYQLKIILKRKWFIQTKGWCYKGVWNFEVLHIINIYCKKCYKIWKCSVLFSGPWFTGSIKRLSLLFFRFLRILPCLNTADVVTLELLKIILKCSLKIDVVLFYLSFKSWNWCSKVAQCGIFDSIKVLC